MTSVAKVAANRAFARLSTGPRTAAGRAVAARNAVRHGAFAAPVVPGEDPAAWEAHRAGVRASLAPAGLLEERLADRAALLLWRLDRLARFEAGTIAAGVERALLPKPPAGGPLADYAPDPAKAVRRAATAARSRAAEAERTVRTLAPVAALLLDLADRPADEPVPAGVVSGVFDAAGELLAGFDLSASPPRTGGAKFLALLGRAETSMAAVPWTAGLVRHGLGVYAALAGGSAGWLATAARDAVADRSRRAARTARAERRAAAGLAERDRLRPVWRAGAALLPGGGVDERIVRYEGHLHRLLTATLHELERLQAVREGAAGLPLAVVDGTVSAGGQSGGFVLHTVP